MRVEEVLLTPSESKKMIAKGVWNLPHVKKALQEGIVAIHPSSTTYFMMQEMGMNPTDLWILGAVRQKGLCVSRERQEMMQKHNNALPIQARSYTWVFEKGQFVKEKRKLDDILALMGPGDIYVKGCNALDSDLNAGVFFANQGGGTIGLVNSMQRKQGFSVVLPVGLEKLIPVSIKQASRAAARWKVNWSMGQRLGVFPIKGQVITEHIALSMLSGAEVTPFGAGGVEDAQGSTAMVIIGSPDSVEKAQNIVRQVKGAKLPPIREALCEGCNSKHCDLVIQLES